jgi:hypothetical protein
MNQDKRVRAISPAADAVALLMADHEEVKALFARYDRLVIDGAASESRHELAESICVALTVNITAEEEIFYPAACAATGAHDVLQETAIGHHGSRHLIADIVNMAAADPALDATVRVLGEGVDQRIREAQGRLFPKLMTAGVDLGALGARIAERKGELMAEMEN